MCPSCIAEHEKQQAEINRKKLEEERRKAQERVKIQADVNQTRMNACFLRNMEPVEFERLVLRIYELHGFSVKHTPASGDGGIDGFIRKGDALVLLQCKDIQKTMWAGQPCKCCMAISVIFKTGILHSK